MKKQSYSNHKKYYPPHHFIFLPLVFACIAAGAWQAWAHETDRLPWLLFTLTNTLVFYLAIMMRQHYALGNQDRIVRLEFRLRHVELTGEPASAVEQQLSFSQIAALRFASDEEYQPLLQRTIIENLTADIIKKSIKNWRADNMRV